MITLLGFYVPFLLGGAVVVETIFALPGVGRLALDSVSIRDYPVILTINVLGALAVLVGNLLADIGYAVADPRGFGTVGGDTGIVGVSTLGARRGCRADRRLRRRARDRSGAD